MVKRSPKLRVAVVGVGYLGRFHALIYARMPAVELVAVVDQDPARAQRIAAEAGCAAFPDLNDLLGQIDAASIVVPTQAHLAVAEPLLQQGIPVLVEKPIAANRAAAERLVSTAEATGTILQVGHVERFNAGVIALADQIQRPRFLEAQRLGSFVERATDVDVVADLMIHDIDIILSLMEGELVQIDALGTPVLTDQIDIAHARLSFSDGAVANVVASRVSEKKVRQIRVFQEHKYLSLDFLNQTLDRAYPEQIPGQQRPEIRRERLAIQPEPPLDRELAHFVHCVQTGRSPLVDGRAGLEALEVALQIQDCIRGQ